jgi:hypothetical protein
MLRVASIKATQPHTGVISCHLMSTKEPTIESIQVPFQGQLLPGYFWTANTPARHLLALRERLAQLQTEEEDNAPFLSRWE